MRNVLLALIFFIGAGCASARTLSNKPAERSARMAEQNIYYQQFGSGRSALVFVHGWSSDHTVWKYQVTDFSATMPVLALDLIGHGKSDVPTGDYTFDLFADSIDAVLRDAGVEKAVLVGHSNGMPTIRQFYRKYPSKTLALINIDGTLRPFFTKREEIEPYLIQLRSPDYKNFAMTFVSQMKSKIMSNEMFQSICDMMLRTPQKTMVGGLEANLDPALRKDDPIRVPFQLILAKQPAWTPEYKSYVLSLAPHADYREYDGVGHFLHMEKPETVNAAIHEFLRMNRLLQ